MTTSRLESGDCGMRTSRQDVARGETVERVLRDLYDLLELYAPGWYGEGLHERINSALSHSGNHHETL